MEEDLEEAMEGDLEEAMVLSWHILLEKHIAFGDTLAIPRRYPKKLKNKLLPPVPQFIPENQSCAPHELELAMPQVEAGAWDSAAAANCRR